MYCFECGFELVSGAKFCSNCGISQANLKLSDSEINIPLVDETDLISDNELKYYNGKLFSGQSIHNWEYYIQTEDMECFSDDDLVKKKRETNYFKGKLHGSLTVYTLNKFEEFILTKKQEYINGVLNYNAEFEIDGTKKNKQVYNNGTIELSEIYLEGKIWLRNFYSGVRITKEEYYSNLGQLSSIKTVVPDSLGREKTIGVFESYNEDGTPIDKLFFDESGNPDGVWKRYNHKGELFLKQVYKNGRLISENYDETKKRAWFIYKGE